MLSRLILIFAQVVAAWFLEPVVNGYIPPFGQLDIFITAAIFAVVVWLVGFLGAIVLKDVGQPSPATLTFALVGGLIGAGLTLVPAVTEAVAGLIRGGVPTKVYPLIGALLGYLAKR